MYWQVGKMHWLLQQVPLVKLDPWHDDRVLERAAAALRDMACFTDAVCWKQVMLVTVTHCPTAKRDHSPR